MNALRFLPRLAVAALLLVTPAAQAADGFFSGEGYASPPGVWVTADGDWSGTIVDNFDGTYSASGDWIGGGYVPSFGISWSGYGSFSGGGFWGPPESGSGSFWGWAIPQGGTQWIPVAGDYDVFSIENP